MALSIRAKNLLYIDGGPSAYSWETNSAQDYERIIAQAQDIGTEDHFPIQCLDAMKGLWQDESVQRTIKRGNEYALHDNIQ